jgi:hypothetical protein
MEFLTHGKDADARVTWSIDDCNLTIYFYLEKWHAISAKLRTLIRH